MLFRLDLEKNIDVVGIGRNSWDRIALVSAYPPPNQKIDALAMDQQPGGQVATTLVAGARMGLRTRYLGKFGDDAGGRAVRSALVRENIDLSESKVVPGVSNQSSLIVVDQKNRTRNVFSYCDPRLEPSLDDFSSDAIQSGKILFLGARNPQTMIPFAALGKEAGCLIVLDADTPSPSLRSLMTYADVAILPETLPQEMTGNHKLEIALEEIQALGPSLVCCTCGERGAFARFQSETYQEPALKVDVLDTTGAGDVFQGAFLSGLLRLNSLSEILRFSNTAAAMKCQHLGGQKGIPTFKEIQQFLQSGA